MPLDEQLLNVAHRLSSQSATIQLELCALEPLGEEAVAIASNLRLVAQTLADLAGTLEGCAAECVEG